MKMGEIVVGEEYAFKDWGETRRVTVLETGVKMSSYPYKGVKVKDSGRGVTGVYAARNIKRPWAEQEKIIEEQREKERAARERRSAFHDQRLRLEHALMSHGLWPETRLSIACYGNAITIKIDDVGLAKKFIDQLVTTIIYTCPVCTGVNCSRAIINPEDGDTIKCLDCHCIFFVEHGTNIETGS